RDQVGGLTVQRANTTFGNIGIEVAGAASNLILGNASSTGNVVQATGGTAALVAPAAGSITSASPAGVVDVAAVLLSAQAGLGVGTGGTPLKTAVSTLTANGGTGGV